MGNSPEQLPTADVGDVLTDIEQHLADAATAAHERSETLEAALSRIEERLGQIVDLLAGTPLKPSTEQSPLVPPDDYPFYLDRALFADWWTKTAKFESWKAEFGSFAEAVTQYVNEFSVTGIRVEGGTWSEGWKLTAEHLGHVRLSIRHSAWPASSESVSVTLLLTDAEQTRWEANDPYLIPDVVVAAANVLAAASILEKGKP
jgi:hypothetical protein